MSGNRNRNQRERHNEPPAPTVVYEDNHLIVIDKPPLLATMGVSADEESLVTWTKAWLKQKYQKPGNVYLGVVSRLDAFTTGLIVLARTSKAAGRLTMQFQKHEVSKTYTAILEGRIANPSPADPSRQFELVDWVRKNDRLRRMQVVGAGTEGAKRAELQYRVLGTTGSQTLVEVKLLTGRKHQIRVQFSNLETPVLGDRKYDGRMDYGHPGIALQSTQLVFEHPVKRVEMNFRLELPKHWKSRRFTGE